MKRYAKSFDDFQAIKSYVKISVSSHDKAIEKESYAKLFVTSKHAHTQIWQLIQAKRAVYRSILFSNDRVF